MLSVLYSSTATESFDDEELAALLEQSRRDNADRDITGMLLYRGGRFFQVLEGPSDAVRATLARIQKDPRHTDVRVLLDEPLVEREFAEWTMGYQPISAPAAPVAGFRDTFDDLEGPESGAVLRAARELSLWFRVRSA